MHKKDSLRKERRKEKRGKQDVGKYGRMKGGHEALAKYNNIRTSYEGPITIAP